MSTGEEKADTSAAYAIVMPESRISELERILLTFKEKTTQERIYLEIVRNVDLRML